LAAIKDGPAKSARKKAIAETSNSKPQTPGKSQTPNPKLQKKSQASNPKQSPELQTICWTGNRQGSRLELGIWSFSGV
jgi:hypothetical protein